MAIETINVGNIANDGTGDDLREAFIKVNNNFTDVDSRLTTLPIDGENLGSGQGVYASKDESTLQFKSLVAGSNVTLTSTSNHVTINAAGGIPNYFIISDNGTITISGQTTAIVGDPGSPITTRVTGDTLFIEMATSGIVSRDTNPTLSANLDANYNNIVRAGSITASTFSGNLIGLVHGVDIRDINQYFDNYWDFGGIIDTVSYDSILEWIIGNNDVDLGPLVGSGILTSTIDLGSFV